MHFLEDHATLLAEKMRTSDEIEKLMEEEDETNL